MTKEELREHCEKQVKICEMLAEHRCQEPSGKIYEEHKLILELLEERGTSDDCVSRADLIDKLEILDKRYGSDFYWEVRKIVDILPPVTPTHHKSATNGEEIIRAFPELKYTIQNGRVVTTIGVASSFDLEWWNAPYEMRGDENIPHNNVEIIDVKKLNSLFPKNKQEEKTEWTSKIN